MSTPAQAFNRQEEKKKKKQARPLRGGKREENAAVYVAPQKFKEKADGSVQEHIHGKNALSAFFHIQAQEYADDNQKNAFQKLHGEKRNICGRG